MKLERPLIGLCLSSPGFFDRAIAAGVNEACFTSPHALLAWRAIVEVDKRGGGPDVIAVADRARHIDGGSSDSVRSEMPFWLAGALDEAPIAQNESYFVQGLTNARWLRNAQVAIPQVTRHLAAMDPYGDIETVRVMCAEILATLLEGPRVTNGPRAISEVLDPFLATLDERVAMRAAGKRRGVTTGLRNLDLLLGGGMRKGAMYTVAARTGVGKTTFGVNATAAAAQSGAAVGFWTTEQLAEELLQKLVSNTGAVASVSMDTGNLGDAELDRIMGAVRTMVSWPVWLADNFSASVERLVASARALHRRNKLDLVVVDYVQQLSREAAGRNDTRQHALTEISRALKTLAMELGVPVLVLAQLNREATKLKGDADVQHIKDSGAIEQDSDVVVIINHDDDERKTYLDVRKNRHGPTARLLVERNLALNMFSDANIQTPPAIKAAFEGDDA